MQMHVWFQGMKFYSGMGSCYRGQPWRKFTTSSWSLKLSLRWSWWYPGLLGKSGIKHTPVSVLYFYLWRMRPFSYKSKYCIELKPLLNQAVLSEALTQSWLTSDKTGDRDVYLYSDSDCATAFKILKIASHYWH